MDIRANIFVSGHVQGIGFRSWCRWLARKLKLKGWVRNAGSGVEAVAEGPEETIEEFVKALWKGPVGSRVENVEVKKGAYKGEFADFEVRHD